MDPSKESVMRFYSPALVHVDLGHLRRDMNNDLGTILVRTRVGRDASFSFTTVFYRAVAIDTPNRLSIVGFLIFPCLPTSIPSLESFSTCALTKHASSCRKQPRTCDRSSSIILICICISPKASSFLLSRTCTT